MPLNAAGSDEYVQFRSRHAIGKGLPPAVGDVTVRITNPLPVTVAI